MADEKKPHISNTRLAIWIVGGVFAVYLIVSGLVGILG